MKVIVADKISPLGVELLRREPSLEVVEAYGSSPSEILALATEASAIIVRSETNITREVLTNAPLLKVVGRAGVGVDNIDLDAATECGVIVMNTPGGNTIATAELTFTHMLCGARPITQAAKRMQEGGWDRKTLVGSELNGKTLGILGMGRIGTEVAKRAMAFGMKVLAYDPFLAASRASNLQVSKVELDTVFAESDYITVHLPLNDETRHIIDEAAISKMKDGVRLYNCARGGIIKESALISALKSGKVAAAGLDVYDVEPLPSESELRQIPNLVLTPHLGASTAEAQESVGIEIAEQVLETLKGGMVRNAINMPSIDPVSAKALRPYLALGEALGTFVQQLSSGTVEKLRITYYGKIVELDALPLSRSIQRGFLRDATENVNDVNAPLKMSALGVDVEVVKSNQDAEYTELIEVEATAGGKVRTVSGTLFGKHQSPRIVSIDGHSVEVNTSGTLLVLKNQDVAGIVGFLGTALGEDGVNIANMSLSREKNLGYAVSVFELDSTPSEAVTNAIRNHSAIEKFKVIQL
ncbi:MAG: phosphoglycerate dehydrogenase [Puniceicoccaceae bacterium]